MTAHRVDLDELADVVASLTSDLSALEGQADVLAREAAALDGSWTGVAFDSYLSARASFDAGFASMRSALASMSTVASAAGSRYTAAASHNVGLWRELA